MFVFPVLESSVDVVLERGDLINQNIGTFREVVHYRTSSSELYVHINQRFIQVLNVFRDLNTRLWGLSLRLINGVFQVFTTLY